VSHYHYLTIEQRERLDTEIRARIATLRGDIVQGLRRSTHPEAAGLADRIETGDDAPLADVETALEVAALEREGAELRELLAARARLHTPDYGVCADCGADIPYARLEVTPTATRCVGCQARRERAQGAGSAPTL
jgi:DnaK suppressor protein